MEARRATDATPHPAAAGLRGFSLSVWCVVAAFGAYFCMYGFRKPFTAGAYPGSPVWGVDLKTLLVTLQVIGYTLSKFIGIGVIAEMSPRRRVTALLGLVGIAQAALLGFGLTPAPWNCVWLFFNGLPLGMVFGLVLGVLEGRRQTEALAAGLCASFIVADGVAKTVGATLLAAGVPPYWMPFAAGSLFTPPLLLFAWMLSRIPGPTERDLEVRSARTPMQAADRRAFVRKYGAGLALVGLTYLFITILRSVRADFAPEIWAGLGWSAQPGIFAGSETIVAVAVVTLSGATVVILDNRRAFFAALGMAMAGVSLIGVAIVGRRLGWFSPLGFMIAVGVGLYLPYIAVHTTLFERWIAMTGERANVGYLMYLVDACGYLGYVAVLLARNFLGKPGDFAGFFTRLCGGLAAISVVLLVLCWSFFSTDRSRQSGTRVHSP